MKKIVVVVALTLAGCATDGRDYGSISVRKVGTHHSGHGAAGAAAGSNDSTVIQSTSSFVKPGERTEYGNKVRSKASKEGKEGKKGKERDADKKDDGHKKKEKHDHDKED